VSISQIFNCPPHRYLINTSSLVKIKKEHFLKKNNEHNQSGNIAHHFSFFNEAAQHHSDNKKIG
jgi:hypothetical protein